MKRSVILLSVLGALSTATLAAAAGNRIRPSGDNEVTGIIVGGKVSTYHRTTRGKPFEFRISGPTPIRVLTRFLYPPDSPEGAVTYDVSIEIDGVNLWTLNEETRVSRNARPRDDSRVGALRRGVVQIPRGTHTVRIVPAGEETALALRVFRGDGRAQEITWVAYAPETYEKAIRLHGRDSEDVYYRFTEETPATLAINGPLRLRIRTRIDFGVERGHSQRYAIKIYLNGELARSFPLSARASHISIYPDLPEIAPGVARDVEFEVPDGQHEISITLDCTTAKSGALRIFIPEQAVTNGR